MVVVDRPGVEAIEALTGRFVEVAASANLAASVPTCGDWSIADLVWHLARVQRFWAHAIANRPAGPKQYFELERPTDAELLPHLDEVRHRLVAALVDADPGDHAWSWSVDQSVAFTLRRQTHEALIHLVDLCAAVGESAPEASGLVWADGVDEVLSTFLSAVPDWATVARRDGTFEVRCPDQDATWRMGFASFVGVDPASGKKVDRRCLALVPGNKSDATIRGDARSVDLWLWGRPGGSGLMVSGDRSVVARLRSLLDEVTR